MPGVSRDQEILGRESGTTVSQPQEAQPAPEKPARPGSLEDKIQRDVDTIEVVPVPVQEPLEISPQ